jgi:hypothetical protein
MNYIGRYNSEPLVFNLLGDHGLAFSASILSSAKRNICFPMRRKDH